MNETNNTIGTIQAKHAKDIVEVFGKKGKEIVEALKKDSQATMLGLLFANFAEKK